MLCWPRDRRQGRQGGQERRAYQDWRPRRRWCPGPQLPEAGLPAVFLWP